MIEDRELTELTEYDYTGVTGAIYHPVFKDSKWQLNGIDYTYSFYDIVYLCRIPDDEALILKLKYGG